MQHKVKHYPFRDKNALNLMLNLRAQGFSYDSLGFLFGCDPTAIIYQCQKFGIDPEEDTIGIQEVMFEATTEAEKWDYIDGMKINLGRNYKDYFHSPRK